MGDLSEDMQVFNVKSERMAVFKHFGDSKTLSGFIMYLNDVWFLNSEYSLKYCDFTRVQLISLVDETDNLLSLEESF